MVMVHKPGLDRARLRPPAGGLVPDRPAARVHRASTSGRRARRAVEGRGGSRSTRRSIPDDDEARADHRRRSRAETGLPADDPVRFGADRLWRAIRERVDALPWVREPTPVEPRDARLRHEVLRLGAPRPVPDRPVGPRRAATRSRRSSSSSRDDRLPGPRRAAARATRTGSTARRPATMAAVLPLPPRGGRRARSRRRPASRAAGAAMDRGHPLERRREVRARHRAPRPRRQGRRACRSTRCSGSAADDPADRLHDRASTSRRSSPSGRAAPAGFPALKIKVGGPADLATLEAVRDVYDGPIRVDANTGWTPDVARRAPARRSCDLGVELIEQPFPARSARLAAPAPGALAAADRGRRERASRTRTSTRSSASWPGSTSSSRSAAGSGPAARMLARARELGFRTFLGCMEETSVGDRRPRRRSRRSPTGSTSTAACCSPPTRSRVSSSAPDHRWRLSEPGLGLSRRAA